MGFPSTKTTRATCFFDPCQGLRNGLVVAIPCSCLRCGIGAAHPEALEGSSGWSPHLSNSSAPSYAIPCLFLSCRDSARNSKHHPTDQLPAWSSTPHPSSRPPRASCKCAEGVNPSPGLGHAIYPNPTCPTLLLKSDTPQKQPKLPSRLIATPPPTP